MRMFFLAVIIFVAGQGLADKNILPKGGDVVKSDSVSRIWLVRGAGRWFPGTKESLLSAVSNDVNMAKVPDDTGLLRVRI